MKDSILAAQIEWIEIQDALEGLTTVLQALLLILRSSRDIVFSWKPYISRNQCLRQDALLSKTLLK